MCCTIFCSYFNSYYSITTLEKNLTRPKKSYIILTMMYKNDKVIRRYSPEGMHSHSRSIFLGRMKNRYPLGFPKAKHWDKNYVPHILASLKVGNRPFKGKQPLKQGLGFVLWLSHDQRITPYRFRISSGMTTRWFRVYF
jgi:hypothetical protein